MRRPYSNTSRIMYNAILNWAMDHEGEYCSRDVIDVILKDHPTFKASRLHDFQNRVLIRPGLVKKIKRTPRGWVLKFIGGKGHGKRLEELERQLNWSKAVVPEKPKVDPDEIDAITFGEKMFVWMENLRTGAIQTAADLEAATEAQTRNLKVISGLQDELSKVTDKYKELMEKSHGKVSSFKYRELVEENKRLKERLDEQNKQITRVNEAKGRKFSLKNMARIT